MRVRIAAVMLLLATAAVLAAPEGRRYAVLVGIDRYERSEVTPLAYAVADTRAVAAALREAAGYVEEDIFVLTDERAAGNDLLWRLDWLARKAEPRDTVLLYFSGHGIERGGETYLLTHDSDIRTDINLRRTAVRMADLEQVLSGIRAARLITFMDACRNDPDAGRGSGDNLLSEEMSRDLALVDGSPGPSAPVRVTFFSCSVGERSYESRELGQGYFSHYLARGLRGEAAGADGRVTADSLERYLSAQVPAAVDRSIGKRQSPWVRREGPAGGAVVLASPAGAAPAVVLPQPSPVQVAVPRVFESLEGAAEFARSGPDGHAVVRITSDMIRIERRQGRIYFHDRDANEPESLAIDEFLRMVEEEMKKGSP